MQRTFDKFVAWTTVATGLAAIVVAVYYGAVMLTYARWTKHNDFREGCINDRDHNLPLSSDCVSELKLPRVSAVKRQIEAVHGACVDNPLYWTVAICIPVLTCVFYMVWMRVFVRDGPKPVVSPARVDVSNCVQGPRGNEIAMVAESDKYLSDLDYIKNQEVHDRLQAAQTDSPPSDSGSDEDYFQAWKDRTKSLQADVEAGKDAETENTHPSSPGPSLHPPSVHRVHFVDAPYTSGIRDYKAPADEPIRPRLWQVEFQPSGSHTICKQIEVNGPVRDIELDSDEPYPGFQPTDGVKFEVQVIEPLEGSIVIKCPLERGATHVELLGEYGCPPMLSEALPKRVVWARRLGLPSHRFLYLIATASRGRFSRDMLSEIVSQKYQDDHNLAKVAGFR
jgi:hypothetical protein